uniref:PDZ domain-containing protein n=1 Tax=Poecilia reticulata TaxID=8081 RepID=A0A3P9QGP2_POERE
SYFDLSDLRMRFLVLKPFELGDILLLASLCTYCIVFSVLSHFTGLVQRCVIIQKDENGFGLTVSGDNPVFVQLVKEDGAAMRAGVQTGDRIIKVTDLNQSISMCSDGLVKVYA